jgi:transcriptional regulator with XRE-family HTH domain
MKAENVLMGKRIADARSRKRWTKAKLATIAGVAPSYITRIEQGVYDRPSVDLVKSIADALGLRVTDLTDPSPAPVAAGIEAELRALFPPERAEAVAEILRVLARHDEQNQWLVLNTMKPLILGLSREER